MSPLPMATGVRRPTGRRRAFARNSAGGGGGSCEHTRTLVLPPSAPRAARRRNCAVSHRVTELRDSGPRELRGIYVHFGRLHGDPDVIATVEPEVAHRGGCDLGDDRGRAGEAHAYAIPF